jgi:hypothetical protein
VCEAITGLLTPVAIHCARSGKNGVLVSAATATPIQSRTSFSASPGTTKDAAVVAR